MNKNTKRLSLLCIASIIYAFCLCVLLTSCSGQEIEAITSTPGASSSAAAAAAVVSPEGSGSAEVLPDAQHQNETMPLKCVTIAGEEIEMHVPYDITIQGLYTFIRNSKDNYYKPGLNLVVKNTILSKYDTGSLVEFLKTKREEVITIVIRNIEYDIQALTPYYMGPEEWKNFPIIAPWKPVLFDTIRIPRIDEKLIEEAERLKNKEEPFLVFLCPGEGIRWLAERTRITDLPEKLRNIFTDALSEYKKHRILERSLAYEYETKKFTWLLVPLRNPSPEAPDNTPSTGIIGYKPGTARQLIYATILLHFMHKTQLFCEYITYTYYLGREIPETTTPLSLFMGAMQSDLIGEERGEKPEWQCNNPYRGAVNCIPIFQIY